MLCLIYFWFNIVRPYGVFCAAVRRDTDSLLRFSFLSHIQAFLCEISIVCRFKYPYYSFSSHFRFLVIIVLPIPVLFVLFLVVVISLLCSFLCSLRVVVSISGHRLVCWWVLFLFFLTHIVYLCYLWDDKPCASSLVFLFSGIFVEVQPSYILIMVPSILQGGIAYVFIS